MKPSAIRVARLYRQARGIIVSPDHYLIDEDTGEYVWSPERVRAAWGRANAKLKRLLASPYISTVVLLIGIPAAGKSTWIRSHAEPGTIYYDATFTIRRHRAPIIDLVKEAGKRVEAIVMNTPLPVCLKRNLCRSPDRRVPHEVIERMHAQLLTDLPDRSEGFDQIRYVR